MTNHNSPAYQYPSNVSVQTEAQAIAAGDVCANCEAPGTHTPEGYDDYCVSCYARDFAECVNCGRAQWDTPESWVEHYEAGDRYQPSYVEVIGCRDCCESEHRSRYGTRSKGDDDGVEYADPREVL